MVAEGFILLGYREQILLVLQDVHDVSPGQQPEVQGPLAGLLQACPAVRLLQPEQAAGRIKEMRNAEF